MQEHGIHARHKRRQQVTTDAGHGLPVAANLLDRHCTPTAPNRVWTSDLTDLWTDEGGLYLAIVLDLFNREVVGRSLKSRRTSDIAREVLTLAWFRKRLAAGLMPHHSDRAASLPARPFRTNSRRTARLARCIAKATVGKTSEAPFRKPSGERAKPGTMPRPGAGSTVSRTSGCMGSATPPMPT
jgi:transposase InsO family protein